MENESQLDRIETKIDYLFNNVVKQTEKNGKFDAHLENHKKANKLVSWVLGVAISLGLFKGMGG